MAYGTEYDDFYVYMQCGGTMNCFRGPRVASLRAMWHTRLPAYMRMRCCCCFCYIYKYHVPCTTPRLDARGTTHFSAFSQLLHI